jgi:regulatory protein
MAGRRRGRTGRGWDAAPPGRSVDTSDDVNASGEFAGSGEVAGSGQVAGSGASAPAARGRGQSGRWGTSRARAAERRADEQPVDPAELAREICLRQLAVRPRTRTELAAALRRRGIAPDVAAEVLDRYGEVGIVDDRAFAAAWVTSRHHGRGLARRALAGELRRKGVDAVVVDEALDELPSETELETARGLVARKLRTERPGRADATFRRLVGMLARKGYPAGLAIRVVKEAMAEWDGTEDLADDLADALDADAVEAEITAAEIAAAE